MNEVEIIEHRQMDGLSVFVNTIDYRTPHMHPKWELIWVLDSPLCVVCSQMDLIVQTGQLALFNLNEPHKFHN